MKKIMIALGVVVMAACAQAASIKWSLGGTGTESVGKTVYIVSSITEFSSVADIQSAILAADSGTTSATIAAGARGGESAGGTISSAAWESQDTVDFYYVVLNGNADTATSYWVSDKQTATVAKGTATPATSSFTGLSSMTSSEATEMVPEPTSGLLLLLGVAGLALRRKQK